MFHDFHPQKGTFAVFCKFHGEANWRMAVISSVWIEMLQRFPRWALCWTCCQHSVCRNSAFCPGLEVVPQFHTWMRWSLGVPEASPSRRHPLDHTGFSQTETIGSSWQCSTALLDLLSWCGLRSLLNQSSLNAISARILIVSSLRSNPALIFRRPFQRPLGYL